MSNNQYFVYIVTNKKMGVIYIGVTNNLTKRIYEHKTEAHQGFTKKYHLHKLIYFECYTNIKDAIKREKQLKKWNRNWKIQLIEKNNPYWHDLYGDILSL